MKSNSEIREELRLARAWLSNFNKFIDSVDTYLGMPEELAPTHNKEITFGELCRLNKELHNAGQILSSSYMSEMNFDAETYLEKQQ